MATSVKKIAGVLQTSIRRIVNASNPTELLYSSILPSANLRAYYRLRHGNLLVDSSGNSFTLTSNSGVVDYLSGLVVDCGGDFGGVAAGKVLSIANNLGITNGAITLSVWYQGATVTQAGDHPAILSVGDDSTDVMYQIGINTVGLYGTRLKQTLSWSDVGATAFLANTWYMCSLTYDGTTLRFYINAVEKGNTATNGNGTGATATQCALGGGQGTPMGGKMNEVFIFNTALSQPQLAYLYGTGLKKIGNISNI